MRHGLIESVLALALAGILPIDCRAFEASWTNVIASDRRHVLDAVESVRALPDGSMLLEARTSPLDAVGDWRWLVKLAPDGASVSRSAQMQPWVSPRDSLLHLSSITRFSREPDTIGPEPIHPFSCDLQRHWLGTLQLRSFNDGIRPYLEDDRLRIPALDGGGGHFGSYGQDGVSFVARFASDCSRRVVSREASHWRELYNIPNANAAYVVNQSLTRLVEEGVDWSRSMQALFAAPLPTFEQVSDDGDALFLRRAQGEGGTAIVRDVLSVDPSGTLRWTWHAGEDSVLRLESQGSTTYVITQSSSASGSAPRSRIVAIADDGSVRWTSPAFEVAPVTIPRGTSDSAPVWALPASAGSSDPRVRIVRAGSGGLEERVHTRLVPRAQLTDGDFAALESHVDGTPGKLVIFSGADGTERGASASAPVIVRVGDLLLDAQGVVVVTYAANAPATVTQWSDDGTLSWRRDLPAPADIAGGAEADLGTRILRLAANPDRVCLVQAFSRDRRHNASCLRRSDGEAIHATTSLTSDVLSHDMIVDVLDDGVLAVESSRCDSSGCTATAYRLDPSGRRLAPVNRPVAARITSSDGGYAGYLAVGSQPVLIVHRPDGSERWRRVVDRYSDLFGLTDDGRLFAVDAVGVRAYSHTGATLWDLAWPGSPHRLYSGMLLENGDVLVQGEPSAAGEQRRMRLRGSDGRVAWQHAPKYVDSMIGAYAGWTESADGRVAIRQPADRADPIRDAWLTGVRVVSIDVETGELVGSVAAPHGAWGNTPGKLLSAVRGDGALVSAYEAVDRGEVIVQFVPAPALAGGTAHGLDASLLGLWQSDDTSGQGIFLDSDNASLSHYGAWFTYSEFGGLSAEGLRWYTLVAAPASAGSLPSFAIFRNDGGRFAQGPASVASQVGTATLRRVDCDHAMFVYRLRLDPDASRDGEFEGIIPLRRSTPRTRPCDGVAGEAASAARGLDPRSSGAWYDPSLPGQGIAFELRPPNDGDAGLFAGGWFTFDPAGQADDPISQHWFTLAGDLAGAVDGTLTVPIYRTLGGRFDFLPTNNTSPVGTATLRFAGCSQATLSYAFDESDVAQSFAGARGTQSLLRVGGCGD